MCEILPKMRKNLLVTIIIQLLGTSSPIPPTGAPPLDPARGGPLWFCPIPNLLPLLLNTAVMAKEYVELEQNRTEPYM